DLGAEKFMNIKCRKAGLAPDCVVLVATVRAMKMNGGVAKGDLGDENVEAVNKGCANLGRHIENLKSFGVPVDLRFSIWRPRLAQPLFTASTFSSPRSPLATPPFIFIARTVATRTTQSGASPALRHLMFMNFSAPR